MTGKRLLIGEVLQYKKRVRDTAINAIHVLGWYIGSKELARINTPSGAKSFQRKVSKRMRPNILSSSKRSKATRLRMESPI